VEFVYNLLRTSVTLHEAKTPTDKEVVKSTVMELFARTSTRDDSLLFIDCRENALLRDFSHQVVANNNEDMVMSENSDRTKELEKL
jgi:hypothetical protein